MMMIVVVMTPMALPGGWGGCQGKEGLPLSALGVGVGRFVPPSRDRLLPDGGPAGLHHQLGGYARAAACTSRAITNDTNVTPSPGPSPLQSYPPLPFPVSGCTATLTYDPLPLSPSGRHHEHRPGSRPRTRPGTGTRPGPCTCTCPRPRAPHHHQGPVRAA
jgi:hypothetical protein